MSGANTSGEMIRYAVNLCSRIIETLSVSQRGMQSKYKSAGSNWNDLKYRQLGGIVNECSSSIGKTLNELGGCLASLNEIEKAIAEYESINISGTNRLATSDAPLNYDYTPSSLTNTTFSHVSLSSVERGNPMTRDEANHEKPNPNFNKGGGYRINCQTCVVAFEARLRGYDVSARSNTKGSMLEELSYQTNKAWTDPETGMHPEYIVDRYSVTPGRYVRFLELTAQHNERYTLEFCWRERASDGSIRGHIISMDRDESGNLRLYDPQISRTYQGAEIENYLRDFDYSDSNDGRLLPRILRIDNLDFNPEIVDNILEVAG